MRFLLLMDHGARALILVLITLWVYFVLSLKKSPEKVLDNRG